VTHHAWPLRRQTYGYVLSGRRASPPFGHYQIILLRDRGTIKCEEPAQLEVAPETHGSRESDVGPADQLRAGLSKWFF